MSDKGFTSVDNLHYWCYKVLPLVYDNSLSYYEVLCKVTQKLNEVISNTNNIPDAIAEAVASGGFLDHLQEQIANANDKNSKTATVDRNTGELIWLNGDLFKITRPMLAGDQYVEDSDGVTGNIEKLTLEDWVNRYTSYIKEAIAVTDQKYNVIADNTIKEGTLLWWKDTLYRAKTDIVKNAYLSTEINLEAVDLESIISNIIATINEDEKYPIYYPETFTMAFKGTIEGKPVITTNGDLHIYDEAQEEMKIVPTGSEVLNG